MEPGRIEPKLKRATRRLALRRFILGRTHRSTADAYYQAGILYHQSGDNDRAARCLQAAERIHRKRLGPGHPAVALDLFSIGQYQAQWGERRRAVQSLERAQKILEARLTADPAARYPEPDGPTLRLRLGHVLSAMAAVLRELDIRGRARTCGEQALAIFLEELGAESTEACNAARDLSHIGVDPLALARELGGEPAATALAHAYRHAHGSEPIPEPMT